MHVLVTGGAGSIGSETVRWLLITGHDVRVLDINEEALWSLEAEYPAIEAQVGDVRDDMHWAAKDTDAIIHCAALKHVHFCERNPDASYRINVLGTMAGLAEAADKRFVLLSTDKAIDPISVMGDHKARAELLTLEAGGNVARFGNVLGSRGSLLPAVLRYKELGQPVPLTDRRMTRFFMSVDEAVHVIAEALLSEQTGGMFVPKKPYSAKVVDLLEVSVDVLAPGLPIVEVGPRPGERLHEFLIADDGEKIASNNRRFLISRPEIRSLIIGTAISRSMVAA